MRLDSSAASHRVQLQHLVMAPSARLARSQFCKKNGIAAAAVTRSSLAQSSLDPSLRCCIEIGADPARPPRFHRIRLARG